ncbi:MAG: hypothetical protein IE909_18855 [Campylobacterales bacterium]|nr:hypothetical protein [Campylobacterales bacterium]
MTEYQLRSNIIEIELLVNTVKEKMLPPFDENALETEANKIYQLYEKNAVDLFETDKWKDREKCVKKFGVTTSSGSNFYDIEQVLREINNIIKHGKKSKAVQRLFSKEPKFFEIRNRPNFKTNKSIIEPSLKNFTLEDLVHFSEKMKKFWEEFHAAQDSSYKNSLKKSK